MEKVRSPLRPAVSGTNDTTAGDSSVLSLPDMRGPGPALRLMLLCSGLNHGIEHLTLVSENRRDEYMWGSFWKPGFMWEDRCTLPSP